MIILSIDVTLLDKERFKVVTRRNGEVAKFCEIVLIETPNSEHGDFMAKQGVTKEERAARIEMPILGNAKHVGTGAASRQQQPDDQPRQRGRTEPQQRPQRQAQPPPQRRAPAPTPTRDPDLDPDTPDAPW